MGIGLSLFFPNSIQVCIKILIELFSFIKSDIEFLLDGNYGTKMKPGKPI